VLQYRRAADKAKLDICRGVVGGFNRQHDDLA
jgi:hypothetical protein